MQSIASGEYDGEKTSVCPECRKESKESGLLKRSFAILGPGLITGAADDDPSGISTYSVAGAAYGYATLWIALLTFPLMVAVQLMCARLGMVTGRGLAAAVRIYYPRWVLWGACSILVVANVINIGADLGGMAEATQLITGIRSLIWIPVYAFFILGLLFWTSYKLDREDFQVVDARLVRLCVRFVLRPRRLEARAGGDVRAPSGVVARIPGGARGNSGDYDLSVPLFLAGRRRGRRRAKPRAQPLAEAQGRDLRRN